MSSWCAATIRAKATSSPAMASSTIDPCGSASAITTPIMIYRRRPDRARYSRDRPMVKVASSQAVWVVGVGFDALAEQRRVRIDGGLPAEVGVEDSRRGPDLGTSNEIEEPGH